MKFCLAFGHGDGSCPALSPKKTHHGGPFLGDPLRVSPVAVKKWSTKFDGLPAPLYIIYKKKERKMLKIPNKRV
jgi:hypothetical protein